MKSTLLILPASLIKKRRRTRILRILIALALAYLLLGLLIFRPGFLATFHTVNLVFFTLFSVILILLVTKLPLLLIPDVEGRVEAVRIMTTTASESPGKPVREGLYTVNVPILTLRTPDGKKRKLRMGPQSLSGGTANLDCFAPGDYVAKLNGFEYPLHFKPGSPKRLCAVCGLANEHATTCAKCKSELIGWMEEQK